jgi:hypothetical protein
MKQKVTVTKSISEQLHRMLAAKKGQSQLIDHNLEKGLGNEESLRQLLRTFLPRKFGVAKGKIANPEGNLSRQLDIIIYDALGCPSLFVDENQNQILPIEGVYGVIEVKTTLDSTSLDDAFQNLKSVYDLQERVNTSTNELCCYCPPWLRVFAFGDSRPLKTIATQFERLSAKFQVSRSYSSYSEKSPGFKNHSGRHYLVSSVDVLGKGLVLHMLHGKVHLYEWAEYTLGMFLTRIIQDAEHVKLPDLNLSSYLNWVMIDAWRGLKNSKNPIILDVK